MAHERTHSSYRLILGGREGLGHLHVGVEAFLEFSFWLAEELEALVRESAAKWPAPTDKRVFGFVPPLQGRGP